MLALAAGVLMHAHAATAPLDEDPIAEPLACFQPVDGLTWIHWSDNRKMLDQ
jgi:hypothetical protein